MVLYPLCFPDSYHLGVGISAGAMAVSTVGVVLLLGLAHQLAIGQAAFSMIGGYANAILCVRYGWDPFVAMLAGAVLAMLLAYAIARTIAEAPRLRAGDGDAGAASDAHRRCRAGGLHRRPDGRHRHPEVRGVRDASGR